MLGVFQSPSLRGSGRFNQTRRRSLSACATFQSPSLRGSGRFTTTLVATQAPSSCFNPLHCGAVVTSARRCDGAAAAALRVSIPFIAGQWSLPRAPVLLTPAWPGVSIPFIAGQWSLREQGAGCPASPQVSIPFIAGQWSLPARLGADLAEARVSIPFIAGQWSLLPGRRRHCRDPRRRRFNPLHCGAVVTSRRTSTCSARSGARFNPLHCGAVVTSFRASARAQRERQVSIPFIAGQWSLRRGAAAAAGGAAVFQSPSLRGSGRFPERAQRLKNQLEVSIPFIAGQWSLRLLKVIFAALSSLFQSPSLRGSGRFKTAKTARDLARAMFQSPSLRGSGRFSPGHPARPGRAGGVSIPFIAGQWSLRRRRRRGAHRRPGLNPLHCGAVVASRSWQGMRCSPPDGLNPLHCGAVVASRGTARRTPRRRGVSIPFIAGQWSLPPRRTAEGQGGKKFQSPSLRGSGRFITAAPPGRARSACSFNPLHCGAVVASIPACGSGVLHGHVSIPFIAGQWSLLDAVITAPKATYVVSIPFIAGQWSLQIASIVLATISAIVSIPFIAGQWSLPAHAATAACAGCTFQSPSLRGSGRFALRPHSSRSGPSVSIPFIAGQWSLRASPAP